MTDYYAVLKRAVGGLEHESADVRRNIYDKARAALLGQLKAIQPPLTTAEISKQRLELEEAIRRVEREAAMTAAGPSPARVRAAAAAADAMAAEAMRLASEDGDEGETAQPAPPPPPRPASRATPVAPGFRPLEPRAPQPPRMPPRAQVAPEPPAQEDEPRDVLPHQEPRFDDERPGYDDPADEVAVAPVDPDERAQWPEASDSEELLVADEPPPRRERREKRPRKAQPVAQVERSRPSRKPTVIIVLVLLVLMIGGAAALVWSQRGKVDDVIGDLISTGDDSGQATAPGAPESAASSKNADRLGDTPPDEMPKTVRTITAEPSPEGTEPDPLAGISQPDAPETTNAVPPSVDPVEPAAPEADLSLPLPGTPEPEPEQSVAAATPPADTTPATPGDDLVAQKAILYEQPTEANANVSALNADVIWRFDEANPNGPEIVATADVPERQMRVTVTIRKNNDPSLSASHLVEVGIDTPQSFPGGAVVAVPAFVMKPTEEARGVPLDGAAVNAAPGLFWIAFAGEDQPKAQNLALMRERNWIDIPLVYTTGQRAILTLEKGTPGQRVFEKALAAWGG